MNELTQARAALARARTCLMAPNPARLAESAESLEETARLLALARRDPLSRTDLEAFRRDLAGAQALLRAGAAYYEGLAQVLLQPVYTAGGALTLGASRSQLSVEG